MTDIEGCNSQSDLKTTENDESTILEELTYSAIDNYSKQQESHEQTALGCGTTDDREATRKHIWSTKQQIKAVVGNLPK